MGKNVFIWNFRWDVNDEEPTHADGFHKLSAMYTVYLLCLYLGFLGAKWRVYNQLWGFSDVASLPLYILYRVCEVVVVVVVGGGGGCYSKDHISMSCT